MVHSRSSSVPLNEVVNHGLFQPWAIHLLEGVDVLMPFIANAR